MFKRLSFASNPNLGCRQKSVGTYNAPTASISLEVLLVALEYSLDSIIAPPFVCQGGRVIVAVAMARVSGLGFSNFEQFG